VHLVSFTEGKLSAVETLEVPVTQPLAVLKGDLAAITAQLEQWRGVAQDRPSGWISKSPPTTICMICSVKFRR
jgi:exonuclease SbcD